jgi:FkbM family methyltransferase
VSFGVELVAELAAQVPREPGVEIDVAAIAGSDGLAPIFDNAGRCATAVPTLAESGAGTREVPALTLAALFDRHGIERVDLKVDIEGAEIDALLAAPREVLARIAQITIEFHDCLDPALVDGTVRVDRKLRDVGFRRIALVPDTTDVPYLNAAVPLSPLARLYLLARYRYPRGIGRMIRARGGTR